MIKIDLPSLMLIFALLATLEIVLSLFIRVHRKNFPWILTKSDIRPVLDPDQVKKYIAHGFDPDLGWTRKPNTSKSEEMRTIGEYRPSCPTARYTIASNGARSNPGNENLPIKLLTVGDSYAFGRHVEDNQTWQWFLSGMTKSNVLNFGVGNYGMDQSLLRYELVSKDQLHRVAVMVVVSETLSRMVNMWKHYLEYGNILGFKGRFELEDDHLKWLENPIKNEQDLLNYSHHIGMINRKDVCFDLKFKKDLVTFPILLSVFKNPGRNFEILAALLLKSLVLAKLRPIKLINWPWHVVLKYNFKFADSLYKQHDLRKLFVAVAKRFSDSAKANGATPVLVMVPYLHEIKEGNMAAFSVLRECEAFMPTLNLSRAFSLEKDPGLLYVSSFSAAHLSAYGNRRLAEEVYSVVKPYL